MKCLKPNVTVPYGGVWWFDHRDIGIRIQANDLNDLWHQARQVHLSNNLPLGVAYKKLWLEWLCEDMPRECVECGGQQRLTVSDMFRGTMTLVRHWANGADLESQETAEARAAVCVDCRYNVAMEVPYVRSGCCGSKVLSETMRLAIGAKKTSLNDRLNSCGICHCYLPAAVFTPLTVQCPEVTSDMRDMFKTVPNCWKKCEI